MIEQSDQLGELGAALAKAQTTIKSAIKDATNPHFKSRYADLTAIVEASREALTTNGIAVLQLPMLDPELGRVIVSTMLLHSSGQWIRSAASANPRDLSPQSVGSAITYLRRYGLSAMVGVVAEEDDDAQAAQPTNGHAQSSGNGNHSNGSYPPKPQSKPMPENPLAKSVSELATPKQIVMIRAICRDLDIDVDMELQETLKLDCKVEELSRRAASSFIDHLKQLENGSDVPIVRRATTPSQAAVAAQAPTEPAWLNDAPRHPDEEW